MFKRTLILALLLWPLCSQALTGLSKDEVRLDSQQSRLFRAWMTRIVDEQVRRGPTPRWQQRDCAGLVRFAVQETLRPHDDKWRRASGMPGASLPAELQLSTAQQQLRNNWLDVSGQRSAYVSALALVQMNSRFVSKDLNQAEPGDLLFFDQHDEQHLMIWMGGYVAYHTGSPRPGDSGLRAVAAPQLMQWKDTRWQPRSDNPNFIGVFRLAFLAH